MSTVMFWVIVGTAFFVLTCLAILDIAKRRFPRTWHAFAWLGAVAFLPFLGCLLWFAVGRRYSVPDDSGEVPEEEKTS